MLFLRLQALDQEREAKRKLESMVCSLMQEVERLKEVTQRRIVTQHQRGTQILN